MSSTRLVKRVADRPGPVVLLQDLPRDVERQVAGVHHAAHEAQVKRQKLVRLVHDEDALHVELQATRQFAVPQVERCPLGDVEQARVLELALDLVVAPRGRVVEVVRDVLVELLVLVVADVVARAGPQRLRGIDRLQLRRLVVVAVVVAAFLGHHHRDAHVVRVLAHHRAQPVALGELLGVGFQCQGHPGPARHVGRVLDGELVLAGGGPVRTDVLAGPPGEHLDFAGDDEGTVEADAELADEGAVLLLVARQCAQELLGAGLGDGAQVLHRLVPTHADAVVDHRHGARVLVELDGDPEVRVFGGERIVLQALEAKAVDGVGGVGNQLAQENLPVGVQRVDHQLEQLPGLRLEAAGLGGGLFGHVVPYPGTCGCMGLAFGFSSEETYRLRGVLSTAGGQPRLSPNLPRGDQRHAVQA